MNGWRRKGQRAKVVFIFALRNPRYENYAGKGNFSEKKKKEKKTIASWRDVIYSRSLTF